MTRPSGKDLDLCRDQTACGGPEQPQQEPHALDDNIDISEISSSLSDEDEPSGNSMGMDNYREFYNDDILWALDRLKPIYQEALLLQQAGYKLGEIMEITYNNGTLQTRNVETVKSRIFLAKTQLRKLLTRDGEKRMD